MDMPVGCTTDVQQDLVFKRNALSTGQYFTDTAGDYGDANNRYQPLYKWGPGCAGSGPTGGTGFTSNYACRADGSISGLFANVTPGTGGSADHITVGWDWNVGSSGQSPQYYVVHINDVTGDADEVTGVQLHWTARTSIRYNGALPRNDGNWEITLGACAPLNTVAMAIYGCGGGWANGDDWTNPRIRITRDQNGNYSTTVISS